MALAEERTQSFLDFFRLNLKGKDQFAFVNTDAICDHWFYRRIKGQTSDQKNVNGPSRRKPFQSRCNHTHLNSSLSTFLARVILFFIDDIKATSTGKELSSFPKTEANTTKSLILWADTTIWRPQIYISFPFTKENVSSTPRLCSFFLYSSRMVSVKLRLQLMSVRSREANLL